VNEDSDSSEDFEHSSSHGYHLVGSEPSTTLHLDDDDDDDDGDDVLSGLSMEEQVRHLVRQAQSEESNLSESIQQTIAETRASQAGLYTLNRTPLPPSSYRKGYFPLFYSRLRSYSQAPFLT
jgi:hypothetical protein